MVNQSKMTNKLVLFSAFLFLLFSSCSAPYGAYNKPYSYRATPYNRTSIDGMPVGEPGKCYAKCLINPDYPNYSDNEVLPIYTGSNPDAPYIKKIEYTEDAQKKWVKKKSTQNCLSNNPDDCMVWCLIEIPEKLFSYFVVTDTSQTDAFEYRPIVKPINDNDSEATTEWREVVCNSNITRSMTMQVQRALMSKGYSVGPIGEDKALGAENKAALVKFQRDNGLPIGNLDFKTLEALEIDY